MSNKKELLISLKEVIPRKPGFAIIYSSFAELCPPRDFVPLDAIYVIKELLQEGWTLAFPSFTFSFCKTGEYCYKTSKSETGILSDWVYYYIKESKRTFDPIYSFVVVGDKADLLMKCITNSPWDDSSIFYTFEINNAQHIMLGCGWGSCTQIHRYEQLSNVPYRFFKEFKGTANYGEGNCNVISKMFVRDLKKEIDLSLIKQKIINCSSYSRINVFKGRIESLNNNDLFENTMKILKKDINFFIKKESSLANNGKIETEKGICLEDLDNILFSILEIGSNYDLNTACYGDPLTWDSMAHFQIIAEIEDKYGISFSVDELSFCQSYRALVQVISSKRSLN